MMMIRGRDGGTNFILRIKQQETRLTLQEHDDGDDDPRKRWRDQLHLEDQGTGNTPNPLRTRWWWWWWWCLRLIFFFKLLRAFYTGFGRERVWRRSSPQKCPSAHNMPPACHGSGGPASEVSAEQYMWRHASVIITNYTTLVDKKNQLDVTFCILYFSSNSCSTCFGQPCAHHRELMIAWCYSLVLLCAMAARRLSSPFGS